MNKDQTAAELLDDLPQAPVFAQAMLQTGLAITLADMRRPDGPLVFVNDAFETLTGYPAGECIGRNCRFLQGPDTNPEHVQQMHDAIEAEDVCVVDIVNYTRDGRRFVNALQLGPIYDSDGRLRYYFGSQWDVTEQRENATLAEREREHAEQLALRIRNLFAIVNAIVSLSTGESNRELGRSLITRILALSRAYEATFTPDDEGMVDLNTVLCALLQPYMPEHDGRVSISGRSLGVPRNLLALFSVMFHELATAATRYGALRDEQGVVDISWRTVRLETEQAIEFLWSEETPEGLEERVVSDDESLAHELIERLVATLDGSLEVKAARRMLEIRIVLPVPTEQFP